MDDLGGTTILGNLHIISINNHFGFNVDSTSMISSYVLYTSVKICKIM